MQPNANDFYNLICNGNFKRITDAIQDGFSGMYYVLRILHNAKEKLLAGDISDIFGVTTARTAVILSTLEKKGYIEKSKSDNDARKTLVVITPKGREAIEARKRKIFSEIDRFLTKLTSKEVASFYNILHKLLSEKNGEIEC